MEEVVLEVRCLGCLQLVTPLEVDWLLFRQAGMAVHSRKRCRDKLYNRLYAKSPSSPTRTRTLRKKEVPTA